MSRRRRPAQLLRLPHREGSDSDPSEKQTPESGLGEGSSARPLPGQGSESDPSSKAADPDGQLEELLERTIAVWAQRYGRALSRDEAGQILDNLTAFFQLLIDWEAADQGADGSHRRLAA